MTRKGVFEQLEERRGKRGQSPQPISLVGERQCKQNFQSGLLRHQSRRDLIDRSFELGLPLRSSLEPTSDHG